MLNRTTNDFVNYICVVSLSYGDCHSISTVFQFVNRLAVKKFTIYDVESDTSAEDTGLNQTLIQ